MSATMESPEKKVSVSKDKLRSIMEAASALTALGDEESVAESNSLRRQDKSEKTNKSGTHQEDTVDENGETVKRFIPDHKKPDAALTFPEKLMNLMQFADQQEEGFCISWLKDGKSFVIRNPDDFTKTVLPNFFKATKFSSFTRKLYRWGFRQVNRGIGPHDPIIFGNEYFQRDNFELMAKMRSITAASARKEEETPSVVYGVKRPLDVTSPLDENDQKRALLGHLIQQKAASLMGSANQGLYGGLNPGGTVSLSNALSPGFGLGVSGGNCFSATPCLSSLMTKRMDLIGRPASLQSNAHLLSSLMHSNMNKNSITPTPTAAYPGASSTADIVNAAINALRYSS